MCEFENHTYIRKCPNVFRCMARNSDVVLQPVALKQVHHIFSSIRHTACSSCCWECLIMITRCNLIIFLSLTHNHTHTHTVYNLNNMYEYTGSACFFHKAPTFSRSSACIHTYSPTRAHSGPSVSFKCCDLCLDLHAQIMLVCCFAKQMFHNCLSLHTLTHKLVNLVGHRQRSMWA